MPKQEETPPRLSTTPGQLENEETRLWRLALLFLVFLATALAAVSWDRLQFSLSLGLLTDSGTVRRHFLCCLHLRTT